MRQKSYPCPQWHSFRLILVQRTQCKEQITKTSCSAIKPPALQRLTVNHLIIAAMPSLHFFLLNHNKKSVNRHKLMQLRFIAAATRSIARDHMQRPVNNCCTSTMSANDQRLQRAPTPTVNIKSLHRLVRRR